METIEEGCFVTPAVTSVKILETVKYALDARKLNENCVIRTPHMPNMEKLPQQTSAELSGNEQNPIWISVIDFDDGFGQMKLALETSKQCNFAVTGENKSGYYRFLKGGYGPVDIPTYFEEKIDRTLGHQTTVWPDYILVVTRETKEEHPKTVFGTHQSGTWREQS